HNNVSLDGINALLRLIIVFAATSNGSPLDSHSPGSCATLMLRGQFMEAAARCNMASTSKLQQQHATQVWTGFPVETFTQPLDHFYNSTDATFPQRFWSTRATTSRALARLYYGESIGVQNFSTDALRLRLLLLEPTLEDSANFMRKVKFQDIDEDLTAQTRLGFTMMFGSYAGARASHMRILYPDLVFGAIALSAVSHAVLTDWEYMDVIRLAADAKCSSNLVNSISTIDRLLKFRHLRGPLRNSWPRGLESDQDFVSVLTYPLASWQDRNWDPAVDSTFAIFMFGTNDDAKYQVTDLTKTGWGYLTTAPPHGTPTIISRLLDIDYEHKICTQAFPPGEHFRVPPLPNVTAVNTLGDYHIAADRLAFIDDEADPWRRYAPHSNYDGAVDRDDTLLRPFKVIPGTSAHRMGS
ncbi:hypothetical protein BJV77DRAFT_1007717, partial [Russula vinacea]